MENHMNYKQVSELHKSPVTIGYHNLTLLKNLEHFKHFGYELLIGASRKSMIDKITPTSIEDRLAGTLAIHLESIRNGASIIRCHDVKEHFQAIKVFEAINNIN